MTAVILVCATAAAAAEPSDIPSNEAPARAAVPAALDAAPAAKDASARLARLELADLAIADGTRQGLQIGGAAAAALGAIAVVSGLTPAVVYGVKKGELGQASVGYAGTTQEALDARQIYADAREAKSAYNDLGHPVALGGVVLLLVGGALFGTAAILPTTPESIPELSSSNNITAPSTSAQVKTP